MTTKMHRRGLLPLWGVTCLAWALFLCLPAIRPHVHYDVYNWIRYGYIVLPMLHAAGLTVAAFRTFAWFGGSVRTHRSILVPMVLVIVVWSGMWIVTGWSEAHSPRLQEPFVRPMGTLGNCKRVRGTANVSGPVWTDELPQT